MMRTKITLHSDLAIPPGEYLEEVLREFGLSREEFARSMGYSTIELSQICKGKEPITPAMALKLEKVLSVPAHIWTGLEDEYRSVVSRGLGK